MGTSNLVSIDVASHVLDLGLDDLRVAVRRSFRSRTIIEPLMRLFDLGFVPGEVLRALVRDAVPDETFDALRSAS